MVAFCFSFYKLFTEISAVESRMTMFAYSSWAEVWQPDSEQSDLCRNMSTNDACFTISVDQS